MTITATPAITTPAPTEPQPTASATVRFGDLKAALTTLEAGVAGAAVLAPALELIRVEVDAPGTSHVRFCTYDYEVAVVVPLEASECAAGQILVSHRRLKAAMVAATKGLRPTVRDPLSVTLTGTGQCSVTVNGYVVPLTGEPCEADKLPALPAAAEAAATVPAGMLRAALASAFAATDSADLLPLLTCVRLVLDQELGTLTAVGTDRFRYVRAEAPAAVTRGAGGNLPGRLVKAMLQSLKQVDDDQPVAIGFDLPEGQEWVTVSVQDGPRWSARLLEGDYPRLPDKSASHPVRCDRAALATAVTRATCLALLDPSTKRKTARVLVDVSPEHVTVTPAVAPEAAPVTAPPIPAEAERASDGLQVCFTAPYLLDAIQGGTSDHVAFALEDDRHAAVFRDDVDGVDVRHYLMPCRKPS